MKNHGWKKNTSLLLLLFFVSIIPKTIWGAPQMEEDDKDLPPGVTRAFKDNDGKLPSDLLKELFEDYRAQDFYMASRITTGRMGKAVSKLYKIQKTYGGKLPTNMIAFYQQLSGMKVLAEYQYKNSSIVRIFWILHLPEKYNKNLFYTKIHCIDYFLERDSSQSWKIKDAKFLKEYMLYNKAPQF